MNKYNYKICIDIIGTARCTGCSACHTVCKSTAIHVKLDLYGFYRPVVDRDKCTRCGMCIKYCPVIIEQKNVNVKENNIETKAFAAWSSDEQIRLSSSSGGIFSEFAKKVIDAGGMIAGCVWGDDWTPEHILTNSWADVERMRGSKYVPSKAGDIYQKVIDFLRDGGKKILFSGTPCQVAAMDAMLVKEQREKVILVDFICHGVPSIRVFHLYLDELFNGEKVISYSFRNKALGWQTILAYSANEECYHLPGYHDPFFLGFAAYNLYLMEACYSCPFAKMPRVGDVTFGDFWGCPEDMYDKRGVSIVLANTLRGLETLESANDKGSIVLKQVSFQQVIASNYRAFKGDYPIPSKRKKLMNALKDGKKFQEIKKKYFPTKVQLMIRACMSADDKSLMIMKIIKNLFAR